HEEAQQEMDQASSLAPHDPLDHFLLGEEQYRRGNWDEAVSAFGRTLGAQPGHYWATFFLSVCHLRRGDWEAARAGLTACIARRPDFVWAYLFRSFANEKLGA